MSLEHFKKQVLLLHSEQSTLDSLSSGFNDRYTVHCATSGSEALNTLGDTQIDVIVWLESEDVQKLADPEFDPMSLLAEDEPEEKAPAPRNRRRL